MGDGTEPEVLRRYRHLPRTAALDWQETAHRRALTDLGPSARADLLGELRVLLGTGYRFGPDDIHHVARLVVRAERRAPGLLPRGSRSRPVGEAGGIGRGQPDRADAGGRLRHLGRHRAARPEDPVLPKDHHQRWQHWQGGMEDGWADLTSRGSRHRRAEDVGTEAFALVLADSPREPVTGGALASRGEPAAYDRDRDRQRHRPRPPARHRPGQGDRPRKVTLSSGKEADYYVDLRRITLDGEASPLVGRVMRGPDRRPRLRRRRRADARRGPRRHCHAPRGGG